MVPYVVQSEEWEDGASDCNGKQLRRAIGRGVGKGESCSEEEEEEAWQQLWVGT